MPDAPHDLALPPRTRMTPQRQAVLDAIAAERGRLHARRAVRPRPRNRAAARPRHRLPHDRAPAPHRLDPPARDRRAADLRALPAGPPPPPRVHGLRPVEETELCAAPTAAEALAEARVPRRDAPDRHLRHLRALRRVIVATWIAIPLAALDPLRRSAAASWRCGCEESSTTLIALTGGIVVAVALFDVLPEAFDAVGNAERVVARRRRLPGFFLAERALVLHHRDEPEHARGQAQSALSAPQVSRCTASSTDSASGSPSRLDPRRVCSSSSRSSRHDFADGMNTVPFILRQGGDRPLSRALARARCGGAAPRCDRRPVVAVSELTPRYLLSVYVGFFLFMGATDLLPEAHAHPSGPAVALTVAGFVATARSPTQRPA